MTENNTKKVKIPLFQILLIVVAAALIPASIIFAGVLREDKTEEACTELVLSSVEAKAGDEAVPVTLQLQSNTEGWISAGMMITYDPRLELILDEGDSDAADLTSGPASKGLSCAQAVNIEKHSVAMTFAGTSVNTKDGEAFTIYFKVPKNAEANTCYNLTLTVASFKTRYTGDKFNTPVNYNIKNGTITVVADEVKQPDETVETSNVDFVTFMEQYQVRNGSNAYTWTSTDENVATVDTNGKITSGMPGTAVITGVNGDKILRCNVTVAEYDTEQFRGNVDGDGEITTDDAIRIMKATANMMIFGQSGLTPAQMKMADINQNGVVDTDDAVLALRYYAKSILGECTWDELLKEK